MSLAAPDITHEVFNQASPFADVNLFSANKPLQDALAFHHAGYDREHLHALGAEAGSATMQQHARLANVHKPSLHSHDRFGRRVDQVEFHPSYHALLGSALRHGLHGTPWARPAGGHIERAAAFMIFTEAEPSVLCPVSMTYAVTPALRGNPAIAQAWMPRITSTQYDARFLPFEQKTAVTLGMGMTEKQGGSDVRANTTRAEFDADTPWGAAYRITGHKWFFSAPMCDAFLVLAQTGAGLSCFFLPRLLPDGQVNALRIQRLKDKLGNAANASSEVEFHGATAWLVGEEGRGVPQILAMGALTRLDCALGTAGLMRQSLSIALHHCAERSAFGKPLLEQPLMRNVLADLALESEAASLLALRLAACIDRTENGQDASGFEAVMRRLLTPVAKFWVCKRGSAFAQETMECLGGNGYVEEGGEGVMARIYREMPLNSIWEGAGNIMALDLLRALRGAKVVDALVHELQPARGVHAAFDAELAEVLHSVDGVADEAQARRLARSLALLLQAAQLKRISPDFVFDAFCASRFAGDRAAAFGLLPATTDFDSIVSRAMPH
ncbi:isovaleryl-CoA dehydrogenase [Ideonella sp. BN130291]|uniref:isovaleryl-CoA dehydrogenase n=1 Tax=Ideonella sp. BN130291 TaxID=3112940 RepID=UPI002E25A431|nr:isovaleryl-CoA dehydrogenase [Ideonella sp. BN130291]